MVLIDAGVYRKDMEKSLELMERAGQSQSEIAVGMRRALRLLDMQDEVEAEPVVRCKDCKFYSTTHCPITGRVLNICLHGMSQQWVGKNHFCSYGEQREEK